MLQETEQRRKGREEMMSVPFLKFPTPSIVQGSLLFVLFLWSPAGSLLFKEHQQQESRNVHDSRMLVA